jgi:hypothetical protein
VRRLVVPLVGVVLLVVGVGVAVLAAPAPTDLGWFAYTPLDGGRVELSGPVVLVARARLVGAAVAALGLVVLAAGLGYLVGRHQSRPVAS